MTLSSPREGPISEAGYPWLRLDVGGLGHGEGARAVGSWPRALRLAQRFDVVYLNSTVCGRLLPALRGTRSVLHVHDIVDRVPRHWASADVVLADSQAVADRLDGLDAHVVYCPVELDPPPADPPWPRNGGGPVIGFVGRIEPRKGVLDLIAAAPSIRERSPGAQVVIVGDDPWGAFPDYLARVRAADDVDPRAVARQRSRAHAPLGRARRAVAAGAVRHGPQRGDGRRDPGRGHARRRAGRGGRRRGDRPARRAGRAAGAGGRDPRRARARRDDGRRGTAGRAAVRRGRLRRSRGSRGASSAADVRAQHCAAA